MLAIKLHEHKKPFLGNGAYFIPVTIWKVASDQIRRWLPLLTGMKTGFGPKRRFITLVKIPDEHPVRLDPDWIGGGNVVPMPLRKIPRRLKRKIMGWKDVARNDDPFDGVGAACPYAQLILGAPLPKACVKWTKDIRVLFEGDKRARSAKKGAIEAARTARNRMSDE